MIQNYFQRKKTLGDRLKGNLYASKKLYLIKP